MYLINHSSSPDHRFYPDPMQWMINLTSPFRKINFVADTVRLTIVKTTSQSFLNPDIRQRISFIRRVHSSPFTGDSKMNFLWASVYISLA